MNTYINIDILAQLNQHKYKYKMHKYDDKSTFSKSLLYLSAH